MLFQSARGEPEIAAVGRLEQLFEYLQKNGWLIVVAGRHIPNTRAEDSLQRFSREEILEAAQLRPNLNAYFREQEDDLISALATLSFKGNPLWLQVAMNLLENLLAEGKELNQLAKQPDYLQGV